MTTYYNPITNQTAKVNSTKADKDGNVWVQIDGDMNFYQAMTKEVLPEFENDEYDIKDWAILIF